MRDGCVLRYSNNAAGSRRLCGDVNAQLLHNIVLWVHLFLPCQWLQFQNRTLLSNLRVWTKVLEGVLHFPYYTSIMVNLNTDYSYIIDEGRHYPRERFWVDLQPWLKSCGFTLRDRYRPDWIASWLKPGANKDDWPHCEDSLIPDVRRNVRKLVVD